MNPALLCRKMPIAPPQPLSPLRCPPRSTDLSILSRSLTRPRKAGQGGRGGRRKGGVVYPRIPTLSARPKASDNLAHHRYSSLASQLSCKQLSQSNRHIFSRCKQCSARAPYDPFVSNQPRSAQSNEYEMRYGMRKLTGSCPHVIHLRRS